MSRNLNNEFIAETEALSNVLCLPDRDAKIAEMAYYKAESRGFEPGYELEDWFAAEQEFEF